MKIIMLKTENGSIDGIRVKSYEIGTEHDLTGCAGSRSLAAAFVGAGMAREVEAEPEAEAAPPVVDATPDAAASESVPVAKHNRKKK